MGGTPSAALQRPDLGATFEEFDLEADRRGFIADLVAPAIDVAEQSGNIGKVPIESLLQDRDTARTSGGGYARQNFKFSTFSYATEEHGAEEVVDDRRSKIYKRYIDAELIATKRALDVVLRNREKRVASLLFNATTWASYKTTIVNEWDDYGNATPIDDVETGIQAVIAQCGLEPNALILNRDVLRNLRHCEQIVDRVKYAGFDDPKLPLETVARVLAEAFGLRKVIVAGGLKNTAKQGQDASIGRIWNPEYAMLARVAEGMDPQEPCVARSFHYTEDGSELNGVVETYREEGVRGDIVRVRHETDEVVMYTEAAHLFENVTTI